MNRVRRLAILTSLVVGLAACGGPPADGYPGHGVVKSVDPQTREVVLDHDDIEGLMKGMTMTFVVEQGVDLAGIEAGSEVDFRVKYEGGRYVLTRIEPGS